MATTGITNGSLVTLYKKVAGTPDTLTAFANGTGSNFNIDIDQIEVSNKDSGAGSEFIPGKYNWTLDFEGFYEDDASVGSGKESAKDILTMAIAKSKFTAQLASSVTGDIELEGDVYISNFSLGAPYNDGMTFTCTLQGTGVITLGTV